MIKLRQLSGLSLLVPVPNKKALTAFQDAAGESVVAVSAAIAASEATPLSLTLLAGSGTV